MPEFDPREPYNALPLLPPSAEIETIGVMRSLNLASRSLANLNGTALSVPNPQLLIDAFAITEAVASSEIENVNTTSDELFRFMAVGNERASDATKEAARYRPALSMGIDRLQSNPRLDAQLFVDTCSQILGTSVDVRESAVFIGNPRTRYVAYTPPYGKSTLLHLLDNLLNFANETAPGLDPIIKMAIMHYQFEAIHPYRDGNGRMGRLLIPFFLQERDLIPVPLLYLSAYFERDRQRYYDELLNVSMTGDWDQWLLYFLEGVETEARDTVARVRRLRSLQDEWRTLLQERRESVNCVRLLDEICAQPVITARRAAEFLGVTGVGARRMLDRLCDAGILRRSTRNRPNLYTAERLIEELERPLALTDE